MSDDHPTALGGTCNARFAPLRELFVAVGIHALNNEHPLSLVMLSGS